MSPDVLTYLGPLGIILGLVSVAVTYLRGSAVKASIDAQEATIAALESRIRVMESDLKAVTTERDALREQNKTLKDVLGARDAIRDLTAVLKAQSEQIATEHNEALTKMAKLQTTVMAIGSALREK